MGRLKQYIKPYYLYIAFTMLIKLAAAVAELFVPFFMERILREGVVNVMGTGMVVDLSHFKKEVTEKKTYERR